MLRKILAYIAVLFLLLNNLGCGFLIGAGIGGGAGYAGYKSIKRDKKKPESIANIEGIKKRAYETRVYEAGYKEASNVNAFPNLMGKEFVFREMDSALQGRGYIQFYRSFDSADPLPYKPYAGKKGKIIGLVTSPYGPEYWKVKLETGEILYAAYWMYKESDGFLEAIYFVEDYNEAKKLLGKYVWTKKEETLITEDANVSYHLKHLEKVKVLGIFTKMLGHSNTLYPFYLKVQKETGEVGLLPYKPENFMEEDPFHPSSINKILTELGLKGLKLGMTLSEAERVLEKERVGYDLNFSPFGSFWYIDFVDFFLFDDAEIKLEFTPLSEIVYTIGVKWYTVSPEKIYDFLVKKLGKPYERRGKIVKWYKPAAVVYCDLDKDYPKVVFSSEPLFEKSEIEGKRLPLELKKRRLKLKQWIKEQKQKRKVKPHEGQYEV